MRYYIFTAGFRVCLHDPVSEKPDKGYNCFDDFSFPPYNSINIQSVRESSWGPSPEIAIRIASA